MLGDVVYESRGKRTGTRVLPSEGQGPKVEVSFQQTGKLLGVDCTEMATYWSVARPDGTLYGDGQGVVMGSGGEMASWRGSGVGKLTGGGGVSFRGAVYFQTAATSWARLNSVAVIFEYEEDDSGNTQAKTWEWK